MAISTYAELQTAVANWIARDDLTSRIPEFITLTEAKFNRDLQCVQMETRSTATVDLSSAEPEFIALPGNFQAMKSLRLSGVTGKPHLEYMSSVQINEYRYSVGNTTGQPYAFTVFGTEIELCPTPDLAYTLEMIYRADIPALSVSNTSNWLLALAPDAYLYGALLEAAPYMQDDNRIEVWGNAFQGVLASLNRLSMTKKFNASPMVVRASGHTP